ncbi:hypothetical protein [Polaromonas sp. UC242_47]|uniref:hypothetical protein n=1 Tax=Polaromonas sp. UC242_47 TaxID=3374626 RepID=UPI0037BA93A2
MVVNDYQHLQLRAFLPAMLGWPEAQWQTAGNYMDEATAKMRADALAKSSWFSRHATSWIIDGESYTQRTLDIVEPNPLSVIGPARTVSDSELTRRLKVGFGVKLTASMG